VTAALSPSWKG